jgi:hypothetical protein
VFQDADGRPREAPHGCSSGAKARVCTLCRERKIGSLTRAFSQDRLYARLQNSRVTVAKVPIMALPTVSRKPPPDYPRTKGEFEHLTSTFLLRWEAGYLSTSSAEERYDGLLQAYGQPIEGDTAAKRETLRIFLALPA